MLLSTCPSAQKREGILIPLPWSPVQSSVIHPHLLERRQKGACLLNT